MTSPSRGGSSDELEGLGGDRPSVPAGRPRAPRSRRMSATPERRVLGRAAAGDDDRLARRGRSSAIAVASAAAWPVGAGVARPRIRRRERGLGRDHVGHVVRRTGSPARRVGRGPGVGRAGEGSGRIEAVGGRHRARIGAAIGPRAADPRRRDGPPGAWSRRTRHHGAGARRRDGRRTGGPDAGRVDGAPGLEGRVRRLGRGRGAWARTVELAEQAEALGFESLWVFDHFHTVPDPTDEITFEGFSVLTALAMATTRVRLGHMVVCTGFRNPALTAKLSSTIDVISGGRFELGIGAGWKEEEWRAYGYGFPTLDERMGALGDHLEVITRMFAPGPGAVRGDVRARPRRHQRAEGPPVPAHPDHRRRERRAADGRLRHQVRRRAQLRLPRPRTRSPTRMVERPRAVRARGTRPGHAAVLALHPRRGRRDRRDRRASTTSPGWPRSASTGSSASRPAGRRRSRRRRRSPRTAGRPGSRSGRDPGRRRLTSDAAWRSDPMIVVEVGGRDRAAPSASAVNVMMSVAVGSWHVVLRGRDRRLAPVASGTSSP